MNRTAKSQKPPKAICILAFIVGISILTFFTDSTLADHNRTPLFSIPYAHMDDGGSTCYVGLGYQIIKWKVLNYPRGYYTGVEKHFLTGINRNPNKPNVSLTYKNE